MRGATRTSSVNSRINALFQSTLLMRGATRELILLERRNLISIHAPHARSDSYGILSYEVIKIFQSTLLMRGATCLSSRCRCCRPDFNPRSSCEERLYRHTRLGVRKKFQSTLLMRGATYLLALHFTVDYFNPRSSCEERLEVFPLLLPDAEAISIHAPHARSDQ